MWSRKDNVKPSLPTEEELLEIVSFPELYTLLLKFWTTRTREESDVPSVLEKAALDIMEKCSEGRTRMTFSPTVTSMMTRSSRKIVNVKASLFRS